MSAFTPNPIGEDVVPLKTTGATTTGVTECTAAGVHIDLGNVSTVGLVNAHFLKGLRI